MIPAGYMLKKVEKYTSWINAANVQDVYAVSNCISKCFTNYFNLWRHNGHWLFDSPQIIDDLVAKEKIDSTDMQLFY